MTAPSALLPSHTTYTPLAPDVEAWTRLLGAEASLDFGQDRFAYSFPIATVTTRALEPQRSHGEDFTKLTREVFERIAKALNECTLADVSTHRTSTGSVLAGLGYPTIRSGRSTYSFGRRLRQISRLPSAERPDEQMFDAARFLESYVSASARARGVQQPATIVSVVDASRLIVEWNIRGRVIRHVECEVRRGNAQTFPVLTSIETVSGRIERQTEIGEASMAELLACVDTLLSHASPKTS